MADANVIVSKPLLSCQLCDKQFGRREHLKRHELSHNLPKFQCTLCAKCFSRKDGLERHELTHESTRSLVHKKARACLACAAAKVRCCGERPVCRRCSRTSRLCTYPASEERSMSDASNAQFEHTQSLGDGYRDPTIEPTSAFPQPAGNIPTHNGLIGTGSPTTAGTRTNMGPEGYMNEWDNSMFNINWLPLTSVDLDPHDAGFHFPFQQTAQINAVEVYSGDLANAGSAAWDWPVPGVAATVITSPRSPEQMSSHLDSTSPASVPTRLGESPGSHTSPAQTTTSGEYYIDGNGARLPRVKRRRLASASFSRFVESPGLSLSCQHALTTRDAQACLIGLDQYVQIKDLYQRLCLTSNFFRPFVEAEIMPQAALSNLVDIFIAEVHPWFPFMHISTLEFAKIDATLIIAMAALGADHVDQDDGASLSAALLEFLRRILLSRFEDHDVGNSSTESLIQAQFWYVIGAKYSGVPALETSAHEILKRILSEDFFALRSVPVSFDSVSSETRWHMWIQSEEQMRLRLSIWLLDSMIAATDRTQPILGLSAVSHLLLPSHEASWAAKSYTSALEMVKRYPSPPDVSSVMQELYMNKKLLPDLGEFAQLLIVHAVVKRTWEMRSHLQHDLAGFEPTAAMRSGTDLETYTENRRRSSDGYQRWRNAACDCLDILHWRANAMVGAARGMEHPGILHLHFARVVLLAPLQEIVALAKHLSHFDGTDTVADEAALQARQQPIRQWVVEDAYKARLAAIHAGVLFWHVKRYSANAYYEPSVLALSTLMLWALSAFSNTRHETERDQSVAAADSPSFDRCDIILIDRPTDDVLVQHFVRQGQRMQALMTGVGNLFGPLGSQLVLREGYRLISSLESWKRHAQYWLRLLKTLELATSSALSASAG